ncbi:MAG: hypothetical protein ACFFC7_10610 [Candidatus Hermodarchaeota archaeon]
MDIREVISQKLVLILDPTSTDNPELTDVNEFLAQFGGIVDEIALVAKAENGRVTYRSAAAPADPGNEEFFPSFANLARDLGVKTHGVISAYGDTYMGQQYGYSLVRSGGQEIRDFVCPSQQAYTRYLATVAREIARQPVDSIILTEFFYPRNSFCFCRRCSRMFSELTGQSKDITFLEISKNANLIRRYYDWRVEIVTSNLREIIESARSEKPNIECSIVIPVDPDTDWLEGAREQFGLDVFAITEQVTVSLIYHIMPFSLMYPAVDSPQWNILAERLTPNIQPKVKKSLLVWGLENEDRVPWLPPLAQRINAGSIFGRMDYPTLYSRKTEIHRGLS